MAFKMNYSFEGNSKNRPEQNLSGASKKLTRDVLLQKTHEERRKRQEQRVKLQSAELLQSHIRSYLARKHKKDEERHLFDTQEQLSLCISLSKLLFFYDPSIDRMRLYKVTQNVLHLHKEMLQNAENDTATAWLLKRFMVLCLKTLNDPDMTNIMQNCLYIFTNNASTLEYLVRKGYYSYFRTLIDNSGSDQIDQALTLIHRPFKYLNDMESSCDTVLSEFCSSFLRPQLTPNVKKVLIPYLKSKKDFPFDRIVRYHSGYHFDSTNSLFYCILALEPDDYEPNFDSIQVLSILSKNTYELKTAIDLRDADSDDEEEETTNISEDQILLSEYLKLMNRPEKVRKWLHFFEVNNINDQVVAAFTQLCHNLLLIYKDSIRKYLLLYKLGLSGTFLNQLWRRIYDPSIESQLRTSFLASWKESHVMLSVFCDMFTFYTETLTDRENSDTSDTFSKKDLYNMSKLLKDVSVDIIDMAYPMCRSSSVPASAEMLHLYRSCLNCVKMLYMLDLRMEFCPAGFWTAKKIHISQDLSRKNYLSKTIVPFQGTMRDVEDDEHLPPLSTIEQRSLAILQELPFLVAFNTRVLLLRDLCRFSLGETDYQRLHNEFMHDNTVVIRRTHLYEDAFEKISTKTESDLKHRVRIQFINNVGLEEAGIDGGGIFKEFINEVLKTAFDPNRGFFLMTADNTLYPNPNVHLIVDNFTDHYYFIGRLVGKAIFENILVDLPLAEFFLAKLLVDRASAHYLKSLDPVLYRNLLYLRDYKGDVSDLGLDFTSVNNDLGETRVIELKPNGRNIPVTNENRLEYIQRLAELKLNTQLRKQCSAFREGLNSVVPLLWLKLFNHNELQVIIGGDTQEIDLSDLRAHTVYGGDFTVDHPTIVLFWKVLNRFTELQKKQLLKFVTSCSRPPLLGFKELNPQFCIQSSGSENRMPTASTCLNLLKIPIIKDEEVLRNKLLAAIEQQAGFELS